jgi:biotin carboxylase
MRALIACASDWTSPARLPRVLQRAGVSVEILCAPGRPLERTRFVDRVHHAPEALADYVDALRELVEARAFELVLIVDDPLLAALAARRCESWLDGVLPIAGANPWSAALASKAAFCALAADAGLPLADSRACDSLDDAFDAAHALGLPLLLKQSSGFAGLGVRAVSDWDEIAPAYRALAESGESVVAQQFLDGPVGNSVFLCDRGRPIAWMSAFKVRTWPGPFGPSSARRFMTHPEVAPLLERIGALTGYHGFGALDWILDGERLRIIELNARPVPTIHMGALAGVDFSRALGQILDGKASVHAQPDPPRDAPIVPMFPEDLWRTACEHRLPASDWLRRPHDLPLADPPLLWFHLRRLLSGRA